MSNAPALLYYEFPVRIMPTFKGLAERRITRNISGSPGQPSILKFTSQVARYTSTVEENIL
jgi:hypothetical protein